MRLFLVGVVAAIVAFHGAHAIDHPRWLQNSKDPITGVGCCSPADCPHVKPENVFFDGGVVKFRYKGRIYQYPYRHVQMRRDNNRDWIICYSSRDVLRLRCVFRPHMGV